MKRLALFAASCALALAAAAAPADEKLKSLMEQARARATGAGVTVARPDAQQLGEREAFLARGEAELARGEVEAALQALDRAASILHAADTEMGLVRAYMQGGEYRRALAFVAHTAGAHRDAAGGAALYAWLLHIGGQGAAAQRLLDEAQARLPADPIFVDFRRMLHSAAPRAEGRLLAAPVRLAPYGSSIGLPLAARIAGSGLLVDEGRRAIVPLATLGRSQAVWVRNGLGDLSRAVVEKRAASSGIAVLRLAKPLAFDASFSVVEKDPFPGSIAFAVEYVESPFAMPSWPLLTGGFLGAASPDATQRSLGIELKPGPRGGPVFDAGGRLVGIALPATDGSDRIVLASRLRASFGELLGASASGPATRAPVDLIYESALRTTLQVIVTDASTAQRTIHASQPQRDFP